MEREEETVLTLILFTKYHVELCSMTRGAYLVNRRLTPECAWPRLVASYGLWVEILAGSTHMTALSILLLLA